MKKLYVLLLFTATFSILFAQETTIKKTVWVDLALPSGTLWAEDPEEGYYTYDEAKEKYGAQMPTRWQWNELYESCEVEKIYTKDIKGVLFTGKNGNSIFIPAKGGNILGGKKPSGVDKDQVLYWAFSTCFYDITKAYVMQAAEPQFWPNKKSGRFPVILVNK